MASSNPPAMAGPNKTAREADLVMATNNSSIVSKRSVEQFYYSEPHFFQHFVKKPIRRSPLVHRGYWFRMYTIAETVRRFMQEPSEHPKFVLSLGCGFDPLPFMLLADRSACRNTIFVDIDYEKLMVNKKLVIQNTEEITDLLDNVEVLPDENPIQLRSDQYLAIGCDLKNLEKLDDTLSREVLPPQCQVLCIAEVSLTYIDVSSADAVIRWASKLSSDVQFALFEQFLPDGPDHPFASTMVNHFSKVGAPLQSIHVYPTLSHQERRFKLWGWAHAHARSLWDLWSDETFVSTESRTSLDSVESFDEWEELALYASHYFLLIASTKRPVSSASTEQPQSLGPGLDAASQFTLESQCLPGSGQRRYGALVPDTEMTLGHHGGLGRQSRLASTSLYARHQEISEPDLPFPPQDVPPRMCHTVTGINEGDCLLVGGRASPLSVLSDCWYRQNDTWHETHSLPVARYRHSVAKVDIGPSTECVLVYGGKTASGECLPAWNLWKNTECEWETVPVNGPEPRSRFGACLGTISGTSGVLFGGIGQGGTVLEDFWEWELCRKRDGSFYVDVTDQTENLRSASPLFKYITRFGATVNHTQWGLVIVGGIIPRQIIPSDKEILLLDTNRLQNSLNSVKPWSADLISAIGLSPEFSGPRPLLTGHASCVAYPSQVLILGGGAVCFGFGTFWTEGTWLLKRTDLDLDNTWVMVGGSGAEQPHIPRYESGRRKEGRYHTNPPIRGPVPCPVPDDTS